MWTLFFQGTVWGWFGLVPWATGLIRWCPLYAMFRINCHSVRLSRGQQEGEFVSVRRDC